MHLLAKLALGAGAVAALGIGWGAAETRMFRLRRVAVPILPPGAAPIRLLHVSDLHLVPGQNRKLAWLRSLAALEPDLVVNTGDNLSSPDAVDPALAALAAFDGAERAFVTGSNDYLSPHFKNPFRYLLGPSAKREQFSREAVLAAGAGTDRVLPHGRFTGTLAETGWRDLRNATARLTVRGTELELVGLDDPHIGFDRPETLPTAPAPDGVVRLGVVHAPYIAPLDAVAAAGARLVLSGHTHGGQLCVPFFGAVVTNSDIDRGRVKGLSRWSDAYLHVSAGLGTSFHMPFRFACRPEATLLTLVPRA